MDLLIGIFNWLWEPFTYGFVVRGLFAGLLAALACGGLSAFVVWRGMAFMGDAVSHSVLPGIVLAYTLGISLFLGALGAALLAVLGIGFVSRDGRLKEDTAIGVLFSGFFALGLILLSQITTPQDLSHILFGNILGVNPGDLIAMAVVVVIVLGSVLGFYKEILVTSFDPAHAVAIGLSPNLIRYGLLLLIALTTVVAIQTVGVVLVIALLVTPGATASLISKKLPVILALSLSFALLATLAGFYGSYYADYPSGATIVVTLSVVFLLVYLYTLPKKNWGKMKVTEV